MQACEEEESQQRQIAAALGVKAAASIASDSSQALSGLRPQASTIEAESLEWTCFCFRWPVHLTRSQTHPFKYCSQVLYLSVYNTPLQLFVHAQVVVVGHNSKPLAHDPRAEAADLVRSASGLGAAAGPINVPKCRRLPKAKYKKSELLLPCPYHIRCRLLPRNVIAALQDLLLLTLLEMICVQRAVKQPLPVQRA